LNFNELRLIEPLLRALTEEGYQTPTPIQQQAIPPVLDGRDLLGLAQTGTGKTAAFTLPMLQVLSQPNRIQAHRPLQSLILTPTRELAIQIGESIAAYGRYLKIRHTVIFGGVTQGKQVDALRRGVDILVATPGRLLDLMGQGYIDLSTIEFFVLDEADRMLDMGFIHDVKRVIKHLPAKRQTLFFSATMPPEVQGLVDMLLHNPVKIEVTPPSTTVERIAQAVYFVNRSEKQALIINLLNDPNIDRVLVFMQMKHACDKLARKLESEGITAEAIHGNKSQNARQRALSNFKEGKTRVLIATDIAARGIDIDDLAYVINYELPNIPETYVHRIGRTGRAGASGKALSFCDHEERAYLKAIEKVTRQSIPVAGNTLSAIPEVVPEKPKPSKGRWARPGESRERSVSTGARPSASSGGPRAGSGHSSGSSSSKSFTGKPKQGFRPKSSKTPIN
jgi:ATP-dependent RNA helicase RhlE